MNIITKTLIMRDLKNPDYRVQKAALKKLGYLQVLPYYSPGHINLMAHMMVKQGIRVKNNNKGGK